MTIFSSPDKLAGMREELQTRVQGLREKIRQAWEILTLDNVAAEILVLEKETMASDFWADPERARRESQKLAELKKEHGQWDELRQEVEETLELLDMSKEGQDAELAKEIEERVQSLEERYLSLEFSLMFFGPYDTHPAIVAVHAGAGGTDAQDWAEMLLRMLIRYAERKGLEPRLLDESRGAEAGVKSATLLVSGRFAYGYLKSEHGVHRLVRQSPFNANALRQTSFALVEVIPEIQGNKAIEIDSKDLRIDTFMSGGKGGQSVNTTYSAVRIVYLPTKITVSCQNERSQAQNKEMALRILKSKLLQRQEEERQKEKQKLRGEFQSAEWGSQIRSYVLHPYKMVKDHRTDVETSDPDAALDGDLDAFVEGYLRAQTNERDLKAELNDG